MRLNRLRVGVGIAWVCAAVIALDAHAAALTPDGVLVNIVGPGATFSTLREYRADGTLVQSFGTITYPGPNSGADYPRTIDVDPRGNVQIYNGTFTGWLTTLLPANGARFGGQGVGFSTVNGTDLGGVAAAGNYVFVTDMNTANSPASGLVRFDTSAGVGPSQRFATDAEYGRVSVGPDGLLYAKRAGPNEPTGTPRLDVFDPTTMAPVRSVTLQTSASDFAVWRTGEIYTVAGSTASRLSPDGVVLGSAVLGPTGQFERLIDVSISSSGRMVMGTEAGHVVVSDTSFAPPFTFRPGGLADAVYVSSTSPVPEPAALSLVGAAALMLSRARRQKG
jgi:hypothetical protein